MSGTTLSQNKPTAESVLETLSQPRLLDLSRLLGVAVRSTRETKPRLVRALANELGGDLPRALVEFGRDELRSVCRAHGVPDSARSRDELRRGVLEAAGLDPSRSIPPPAHPPGALPQVGQVVQARQRQWLVEGIVPGDGAESALVHLVCLDDDDPGRGLQVLWDLELGARVVAPEAHGLGSASRLDPPTHFGAYLHALRWSAVSAADATRFQAPFRAGIKIMNHQLTPLMKALELPRANLFIADDVGLGKTIEAGLVLQELLLRQQADFVLIVCPASVCLQWRDEMQRRFGLRFEVMSQKFVAYRRQERGFGVNAWATHNRFIVSYPLIRRSEYRDPLLALLGQRARKGLLILDEAHVAAPASASKYAVDSETTAAIRDLAPRFDNRLFLSATPHNGHSNSFSALLEILDPVRFTRGVPVQGKSDLEPIMVRRLKRDLRKLGEESFPRRHLVQIGLRHTAGEWVAEEDTYDAETAETGEPLPRRTAKLAAGEPTELILAEKLARYTELCAPRKGQARFVFVNLQQRLLSSPEAFAHTLGVHVERLKMRGSPLVSMPIARPAASEDPELHGLDEETRSAEADARMATATDTLPDPDTEARTLLAEMRELSERARRHPDAKALALLAWLRENLCPGVGARSERNAAWNDRRVILFTEYADTKRYYLDLIRQAIDHTDDAEQRVMQFHGGMGDEARAEVQRAFNTPPEKHPVRILLATDAAREGVNLQGYCADLFHLDIPWNPGRLEQRNGRIDRTLQPAKIVRCHYFIYPDRPEDRVLSALVRKVDVIQRELGSLGNVLFSQIEGVLTEGVSEKTLGALDGVLGEGKAEVVRRELEDQADSDALLKEEISRAGRRLEASRRALEVRPESLRGVVEVGLRLAGAETLTPSAPTSDGRPTYVLPKLDRTWQRTLDTLRPPRERDESLWDWRARPLRSVTFEPLTRLSEDAEQLHLAHPFVKRILDRFLAQGFSAHDLSRMCAVITPDDSVIRVVAYARLSLFGTGAARLHDEIVALAAAWSEEGAHTEPYKDPTTANRTITVLEQLLAKGAAAPSEKVQARLLENAEATFQKLWPALEAEADARAGEARRGLAQRGRKEADELKRLLLRQEAAIGKASAHLQQEELFQVREQHQKRQVELDIQHLAGRRQALKQELETEPAAIEALYEVRMVRLSPIGLVIGFPEGMT